MQPWELELGTEPQHLQGSGALAPHPPTPVFSNRTVMDGCSHVELGGHHHYHFCLFEGFTCLFLLSLEAIFRKMEPQKYLKGLGEKKSISTVRVKTCLEIVECLLVLIYCYC